MKKKEKQQPPVDYKTRKALGMDHHDGGLIYIGDGMYIDPDGYLTFDDW